MVEYLFSRIPFFRRVVEPEWQCAKCTAFLCALSAFNDPTHKEHREFFLNLK